MIVKARAVILIDGRLIVANQRRRGRSELSLPGGRVNRFESVLDAVKREVAEETGLEVVPRQLANQQPDDLQSSSAASDVSPAAAPAATSAWTAQKDRAAATLAPAGSRIKHHVPAPEPPEGRGPKLGWAPTRTRTHVPPTRAHAPPGAPSSSTRQPRTTRLTCGPLHK